MTIENYVNEIMASQRDVILAQGVAMGKEEGREEGRVEALEEAANNLVKSGVVHDIYEARRILHIQ